MLLSLSSAGARINMFQMVLGIMVENITSDSRFGFTDVLVMVNMNHMLIV